MPVPGRFRYQVGEPFYFYDLRADISHNGTHHEVVIIDEKETLKKKRPFLFLIWKKICTITISTALIRVFRLTRNLIFFFVTRAMFPCKLLEVQLSPLPKRNSCRSIFLEDLSLERNHLSNLLEEDGKQLREGVIESNYLSSPHNN